MKKLLLYLGIAIVAIGCAKDVDVEQAVGGQEISFSAKAVSRVADSNDCAWASGDEIGVFTTKEGEANMLYTITEPFMGSLSNDSGVTLYQSGMESREYYAYHPYDSALSGTVISVDCTEDQSKPLLWANVETAEQYVGLWFTHVLTKVTFSLIAESGDADSFDGATAKLIGANALASFDIKSGEFSSESVEDIALTIKDDKIVAYLPPMESVSGNVKLEITTADGRSYVSAIKSASWDGGSSYNYNVTVHSVVETVDIELKPDGIYYINTAKGLQAFADLVNGYDNSCKAVTAGEGFADFGTAQPSINGRLTADIDLSTICGADINGQEVSWKPIGDVHSGGSPFYSGEFSGAGFEVKNLYINSSSIFAALFGAAIGVSTEDMAQISDLGVSGSVTIYGVDDNSGASGVVVIAMYANIVRCYNKCDIESVGLAGGVVSQSMFGDITSCYNTGDIHGYNYVGGVIGGVQGDNSTVYGCYNTGNVSGIYQVGGVQGYSDGHSLTTSCYNLGDVIGASYVGGVAGDHGDGRIIACYNRGDVKGEKTVGGIAGQAAESLLQSCYNSGSVAASSGDYLGAIIGSSYHAPLRYCYYDKETLGAGVDDLYTYVPRVGVNDHYNSPQLDDTGDAIATGFAGLTTAEMKDRSVLFDYLYNGRLSMIEFDPGMVVPMVWVEDYSGANNGYPVLSNND